MIPIIAGPRNGEQANVRKLGEDLSCRVNIESFPSRLRDEFLEREEFESVADAGAKASWYRGEYNPVRPPSSLGDATPKEFSAACDGKGWR